MIFGWLLRGLRTGIVTTRYPAGVEPQPSGVRNQVALSESAVDAAVAIQLASVCPTGAIRRVGSRLELDLGRCILCGRCVAASSDGTFRFSPDYEVATRSAGALVTGTEVR